MHDPLQYEGTHAVVTGCASGMGAATAAILTELGATVTGLDVQDKADGVARFHQVDLKDKASIDAAVAAVEGPVDSVFSVAGLPGPPFSDLDTVMVNFVGPRHLIESLAPKMPRRRGRLRRIQRRSRLGAGDRHAPARRQQRRVRRGPGVVRGQPRPDRHRLRAVEEALNAWVAWRAATLLDAGIRLNVSNPGPTDTAMMPAFEALAGKAHRRVHRAVEAPLHPEEQAWPLVFLNSRRSSYVAGESLTPTPDSAARWSPARSADPNTEIGALERAMRGGSRQFRVWLGVGADEGEDGGAVGAVGGEAGGGRVGAAGRATRQRSSAGPVTVVAAGSSPANRQVAPPGPVSSNATGPCSSWPARLNA